MDDHARPLRAALVISLQIDGVPLTLRVEREAGGRTHSTLLDEEGVEVGGVLRARALARHAAGEGERVHEELEWELQGTDGGHRLLLVRDQPNAEPRPVRAWRLDAPGRELAARERGRLARRLAAARQGSTG